MKNIWKEISLVTACIIAFDFGILFLMNNFPGEATKAAEYKHEIVRTQKTIYYFMFCRDKSLIIE
jgi:hypothetical protein